MPSGVGRVGFLPMGTGGTSGAATLLGDEWNGLAIDFTSNTYLVRVSTGAEALFGPGPVASAAETGVALDFTDNSSAMKV